MAREKRRLGDILLSAKVIDETQLETALKTAAAEHKKIGETLIELGMATEEAIAKAISRQQGFEIISLNGIQIEKRVLELVKEDILRKYVMIPIAYDKKNMNVIRVAMANPLDIMAIDEFSIVTNLQVEPMIATSREITLALDKYYGNSETLKEVQEYAEEREALEKELSNDEADMDVNSSPIVKLVNSIIEQAARQRASDIHIEALENSVRVRYRIDGALYEKSSYSIHLLSAITARLKIMGGMDISEKRKPQDGRITIMVDRKEYDIRVSMLPTVYGEKCVMRLAQKKSFTRDKKDLGFSEAEMVSFEGILKNPNGILLVTGPTGSGKSTTLYTALSELNKEDVNIITVEDPVEANIDGVNQVQVNNKAELTFASALRSILRQDPDIIMVGEIRDAETAQIAVQASITGHLVVSTLHTNSAAGSLTRLMDMGVESYLLADSMVGVIAQRLVRKLCPYCKKEREATPEEKVLLGLKEYEPLKVYDAAGCPQCDDTGYHGRTGVYEIMTITPEVRSVIAHHGNTEEIRDAAMKNGMRTLRMNAAQYVVDGTTTISEMLHVAYEN